MAYKYREVICPWCDHKFMWQEDGGEGPVICEYEDKETGKYYAATKCPKCSEEMVVLNHILQGIDTEDPRLIKHVFRGI